MYGALLTTGAVPVKALAGEWPMARRAPFPAGLVSQPAESRQARPVDGGWRHVPGERANQRLRQIVYEHQPEPLEPGLAAE